MSSLVNNQSASSALSLSSLIRFSLKEIERATNNFASEVEPRIYWRELNPLTLYLGNISRNSYNGEVLVKRFSGWQAPLMYLNEVTVLTALHHVNIISLVGFCDEKNINILVYEFVSYCSLYDYLYVRVDRHPCLTVEQILEICLGVAKGLCYLHSGTDFTVVHAMINSKNIFLDASLVPKISGFGYARQTRAAGPSSSQEIITNTIEGDNKDYSGDNKDYSPPERHEPGYIASQKDDVYAFGILFLEVLCERQPSERLLLLTLPSIMIGELFKATPEHVKKNITPVCAQQCEKLIMSCLEFQPDKRPCMNQVVQDLELALKLQTDQHINFEEQSSSVSNRCQSFSLVEIERARNESSNKLGEGGFGEVYHGKISSNGKNVDVAMKFLSKDPEQGIPAFEIEKNLLSACDHVNIISLMGYCDEKNNKILVYEFMRNGSLYDYLYNPKDGTHRLTVEQRLEICLGVAKGLTYLHSRKDYNIIHSDLKTDNILLDANLVPKISDFGLSRTRAVGPSTSSLITKKIQGTNGYIAPECYEPNYKVSRKADVYAFGVILLEVLCEKRAWNSLIIYAQPYLFKGELPTFSPKYVRKNISPECSRSCMNLVRNCLDNDPNNRPSMSLVITNLDLSLALQKMKTDGKGQKSKYQANSLQKFSLSVIETATNKFAQQNLLGEMKGLGYGSTRTVYCGNISTDVAVKHVKCVPQSVDEDVIVDFEALNNEHMLKLWFEVGHLRQEAIDTFQNEINSLSACHHANIISLLGYCDEQYDKILIYEFMPNGSLYDHLYIKQDSANHLRLEQHLEICLGVAKGLSYLHSSNFVHGCVNSKSILLDRNFVAKITSFEFSRKCVPEKFSHTVPGIMKDYFAPECHYSHYKTSQEADVYAFGVLLLEVLLEKPAWKNLVTSAIPSIMGGELAILTPEHVRTYLSGECARACENLLRDCLEYDPGKRPSMNQVVDKLELALKLQTQGANY